MNAIHRTRARWRHVASRSTEAADVVDASDDGVSVVALTSAVDAGESWSMCDLNLEHFLQSPCRLAARARRRDEKLWNHGEAARTIAEPFMSGHFSRRHELCAAA